MVLTGKFSLNFANFSKLIESFDQFLSFFFIFKAQLNFRA